MNNSPLAYSPENTKSLRSVFSSVGLGVTVLLLVTTALQYGIMLLVNTYAPAIAEADWYIWALSVIPLYLGGAPLAYLCFRRAPALPPERKKPGIKGIVILFIISFGIMYVSNYIGTFLMAFFDNLTGRDTANALDAVLANANPWITAVATVIIAPIGEELLFRKLIVDRTRVYGELTSILLSGLLFGLFHTNIFQFFYAFSLGCFFAFVYIRTGKIWHTMVLHAGINLLGGVIGPFVLKLIDLEKLEAALAILDPENTESLTPFLEAISPMLVGLLVYMLYAFALMALSIAGVALFILHLKRMKLKKGEFDLPREAVGSVVYMNVGMVCAILLCAALTVMSVFA